MYLRNQLHSENTINVTDALKRVYQTEIKKLTTDDLLDEAMRIHSDKRTSEIYGTLIRKEIEKR